MEKHLELYLRVDLHHQSVILKEADIILNNFNVAHLPCSVCVCVCVYVYIYIYTGCHRRKGPKFGRVFLMLNYTVITQNTYIQS